MEVTGSVRASLVQTRASEQCEVLRSAMHEPGFFTKFYRGHGKRALDLVIASAALLVLGPFWLLLIVLVRVNLGQPVFFTQERGGFRGERFNVVKFRTMTDARDTEGQLLPDRQRLTRTGNFLRSTSFDELPEIINVLRGEMSLVGPRPFFSRYLDRYTAEQKRRHDVRPGITGWAQVNGRNAITWEQKFDLDNWYVDHHSFWIDLKIVTLTVWKLIRREGIQEPGEATAREFMGSVKDNL